MAQVNGIVVWTEGIKAELAKRLPKQRKTQRDKLAVLVATMLHVRSANLVELAAGLPRDSDRWDMGYQWISQFLENDLVSCDTVMQPFAVDILARADRTRRGDPADPRSEQAVGSPPGVDARRALGRARAAAGVARRGDRRRPRLSPGFLVGGPESPLDAMRPWLPRVLAGVVLYADRFYGTPRN